ncbi:MAG: transposase [Fibrobacter sp.]|nr:transposase [Fibrobacter sp.]
MEHNNSQDANYWIHGCIISVVAGFVKVSQKRFSEIFWGFMRCLNPTTIYSWIRAAGKQKTFQSFYYQLKRIGQQRKALGRDIKAYTIQRLAPLLRDCPRIYIVGDDTQTNHPGPKIEGAYWMKDSTPQATDAKMCRGHSWVVLTIIVEHPQWGTLSFVVRTRLYLCKKALEKLRPDKRRKFCTKTRMLVTMVGSVLQQLREFNKPITLLIDGGYANQTVLEPMRRWNVEVITRYRKDAIFYSITEFPRTGKRGRPRKPQKEIYDMERCAECENSPWQTVTCEVYGSTRQVQYKAFQLRSNISDGEEVLVIMSRWVPENPRGKHAKHSQPSWMLLVSTNLELTPKQIIESYAKRFTIEETFKDLKEIEGLGKPQVRNLECTEASFLISTLGYNLVELWALDQDEEKLKQFRAFADDANRRPSHADKRKCMCLELLHNELLALYANRINPKIFTDLLERLVLMGV